MASLFKEGIHMYFFISVAICDLVHIVETFISIKFTANSIWNFFLKM